MKRLTLAPPSDGASAETTFGTLCPYCSQPLAVPASMLAPALKQRRRDGRSWGTTADGRVYGVRETRDASTRKRALATPAVVAGCPKCKADIYLAVSVAAVPCDDVSPALPALVGEKVDFGTATDKPQRRVIVVGCSTWCATKRRVDVFTYLDALVDDDLELLLLLPHDGVAYEWAELRGARREFVETGKGAGPKNRGIFDGGVDLVVDLQPEWKHPGVNWVPRGDRARLEILRVADRLGVRIERVPPTVDAHRPPPKPTLVGG